MQAKISLLIAGSLLKMKECRIVLFLAVTILLTLASCKKGDCVAIAKSPDCICTTGYVPVCGCDGKTYVNSSNAICHGITDYTEGTCN